MLTLTQNNHTYLFENEDEVRDFLHLATTATCSSDIPFDEVIASQSEYTFAISFDTKSTSNLVCPHCGYEHIYFTLNTQNLDKCNQYKCYNCGESFDIERHVKTTYTTRITNPTTNQTTNPTL